MIRVYRIALSVTNDLDKSQFTKGLARSNAGVFRECEARDERTRAHTKVYVTEVSDSSNEAIAKKYQLDCLRLYGQVNKRIR